MDRPDQNGQGQMPGMKNSNDIDEENSSLPQMPEKSNQSESNSSSDSSGTQGQSPNGGNNMHPPQNDGEMPDMLQSGNMQGSPQGGGGQGMTSPDHSDEQMGNQESPLNSNSYIMLGVCASVLLVGLLSALLYKKRV